MIYGDLSIMAFNHSIIIDNYCGWPNLTKLQNGNLITTVFNKPSHLQQEGEIECFISKDEGANWQYLSTPFHHKSREARANCACGVTANGSFMVLCGGWNNRPEPGEPLYPCLNSNRLHALLGRSTDNGKDFTVSELNFRLTDKQTGKEKVLHPYGNIVQAGSRLACAAYYCPDDLSFGNSYIIFSDDDGFSWSDYAIISENNYTETFILFTNDHDGIALAREHSALRLDQYTTNDGGRTWLFKDIVTGPYVHPGHLVMLANNTMILTTGIRYINGYGIGACISRDKGRNWGSLHVIVSFPEASDGGYPSTVQLANGLLLTHYYSNKAPLHDRYFVGQVIWDAAIL